MTAPGASPPTGPSNDPSPRDPLFRADGDTYAGIPRWLFTIETELRSSALEVLGFLICCELDGTLDISVTDKRIAATLNRSESFVQKGLFTLHRRFSDAGQNVIDRIREGGGRTINFVRGLRGSKRQRGDPPPPPPQVDRADKTTTTGGSSSSHAPPDGKPVPTAMAIDPELFHRARAILPRLNLGKVVDVVLIHGDDVMREALDSAEAHNRTAARDGKKPVQGWGYFVNAVAGIVRRKATEHLAPQLPAEATPDPAAEETRKRAAARARADAEAKAEEERLARLRAAWGLLEPAEQQDIREAVARDNPGVRWPNLLEVLQLAELERRQAAEEPRAP
jgi:hypothetical protein